MQRNLFKCELDSFIRCKRVFSVLCDVLSRGRPLSPAGCDPGGLLNLRSLLTCLCLINERPAFIGRFPRRNFLPAAATRLMRSPGFQVRSAQRNGRADLRGSRGRHGLFGKATAAVRAGVRCRRDDLRCRRRHHTGGEFVVSNPSASASLSKKVGGGGGLNDPKKFRAIIFKRVHSSRNRFMALYFCYTMCMVN